MAGTARGPDEASEWGGPCPVIRARKTWGLNSAGQLELRDRMVEVRAGTTAMLGTGSGPVIPSTQNVRNNLF